jgi:glycosyltransferase involved in cell wall biosynthesis
MLNPPTIVASIKSTQPEAPVASEPVSIIIPAYNEREAIGKVLERITRWLSEDGVKYEVIVVDDGSSDGTGELVESKGFHVIRHPANRGYGAALKSGIRQAQHPLIAIIDSDGTYPEDALPRLLGCMNEYDMAVGARIGEHVKIPLIRRPAKWFLKILADYLSGFNIPDLNSGLRVFRRELAERFFGLFPDGFSFTTTITLAALTNGYRVNFIPINYYKRTGQSSIRPLRDFLGFLLLIIRLVVCFKPLNVFLPISGLLFGMGLIKGTIDFYLFRQLAVGEGLAILAALQIASIGLLADLVMRRTQL